MLIMYTTIPLMRLEISISKGGIHLLMDITPHKYIFNACENIASGCFLSQKGFQEFFPNCFFKDVAIKVTQEAERQISITMTIFSCPPPQHSCGKPKSSPEMSCSIMFLTSSLVLYNKEPVALLPLSEWGRMPQGTPSPPPSFHPPENRNKKVNAIRR